MKSRSMQWAVLSAASSLLIGLAACRQNPYANDIGSTHVAALSVTPWQEYNTQLAPKFELTAKAALEASIPDSRSFQTALLDSFRARLDLRLAPSPVLTEGFGTPTPPARSPEGTPPSEPGVTAAGREEVPSLSTPGSEPSISGMDLPGSKEAAGLAGDAFLKYMAATALFQEVKLLERYIRDAAINEKYEPVIVRLQISNQAFSDDTAYDSYANIAFFCDPVATEASSAAIQINGLRPEEQRPQPIAPNELPIVVPLLVTDQVEAALLASRSEELRQLTLALAAAYAGIGGEVNLDKIDQAIQKAAGRSYRSNFNIGRLADNMLRVRMPARAVPDASEGNGYKYETISRSHFITVLLLVPRPASKGTETPTNQKVYLSTRYEYREPDTGKLIGVDYNSQGESVINNTRIARFVAYGGYKEISEYFRYNYWKTEQGREAYELAAMAQGNQYDLFIKQARKLAKEDPATGCDRKNPVPDTDDIDAVSRRLYMDLNVAKLGSNFDSTSFTVKIPPMPIESFGTASAYMVDNGENTEAVINGVTAIDPINVSATWQGIQVIPDNNSSLYSLASTAAELRGPNQLVIRFPSLVRLGVLSRGDKLHSKGTITLIHQKTCSRKDVISFLTPGTPADSPALTVTSNVKMIQVAKDSTEGQVTLTLVLNKSASDRVTKINPNELEPSELAAFYILTFNGVDAALAANDKNPSPPVQHVISQQASAFAVIKSGVVTFKLSNLSRGGKFTVQVIAPQGGKQTPPLEFTVHPVNMR